MNFELAIPLVDGRPKILRDAADKLCDALERRPLRLAEIHGAQLLPSWQRRRMTPRRPERREALGRVLTAMLEHCDLVSLRVGTPRSDGFVTAPGQQGPKGRELEGGLVRETGLSITRVRRAISTAVRAGWLRGPRRGSKDNRQPVTEYTNAAGDRAWAAHRVVYVFTAMFFRAVGIQTHKLERERAFAVKRRDERRGRLYPAALLAGRELVRGMGHGSREKRPYGVAGGPTPGVSKSAGPSGALAVDDAENEARLVATYKIRLRERHPDWGAARLEAEARAHARALRPR